MCNLFCKQLNITHGNYTVSRLLYYDIIYNVFTSMAAERARTIPCCREHYLSVAIYKKKKLRKNSTIERKHNIILRSCYSRFIFRSYKFPFTRTRPTINATRLLMWKKNCHTLAYISTEYNIKYNLLTVILFFFISEKRNILLII